MKMQIDHISYIFGSFTRRRQSKDHRDMKRRSINHPHIFPTIQHDRSHSAPHEFITSSRSASIKSFQNEDKNEFVCPICKELFIEPRLLACLHTLCTKCLHHLQEEITENSSRAILCPMCNSKSPLPSKGLTSFPLNYLLQHKMMLQNINSSATRLLCDLCPEDIHALYRCNECAVSLCQGCVEIHCRQKGLAGHRVLTLEEARKKGITRVRRQIMCSQHPQNEITTFCVTCAEVICKDCTADSHRNHPCEPAARAARNYLTPMRDALARVKSVQLETTSMALKLKEAESTINERCAHVREEIDRFIESYIETLQEHREKLCLQVEDTKNIRLCDIKKQQNDCAKKNRETTEVIRFTEELLEGSSDVEFLTFLQPVLNKLEKSCSKRNGFDGVYVAENLKFLPEELVKTGTTSSFPLYGILTTQIASPRNSILHLEGIQNLRVGRKAQLLVEIRDKDDARLERGGENLKAEIRHRDGGISRTLLVHVEDQKDGTYNISFTPDVAGKLLLFISIGENQIKDSPFPLMVKTLRPHHGTFHCCSFCASGGSKEASCGCGGKMPGGYRGCGHGHEGHPGKRHWSCCGNVVEHSECVRASSSHYQITL